MERCGAAHPEHGGSCPLDYDHPDHQVSVNRQWVYWPNEGYKPPQDKRKMMEEFSRRSLAAKMPVNRIAGRARESDPSTSKAAAEQGRFRFDSQNACVLIAFYEAKQRGLTGYTPREVGDVTSIAVGGEDTSYWKRTSENADYGYVAPTGTLRVSEVSGRHRIEYAITPEGEVYALELIAAGGRSTYQKKRNGRG